MCQLFKDIKTLGQKCQQSTDDHTQKAAIYVPDFDGDIKASAVAHLREEISAIISVANRGDEVVLRLESGGGQVHAYIGCRTACAYQRSRVKADHLC